MRFYGSCSFLYVDVFFLLDIHRAIFTQNAPPNLQALHINGYSSRFSSLLGQALLQMPQSLRSLNLGCTASLQTSDVVQMVMHL